MKFFLTALTAMIISAFVAAAVHAAPNTITWEDLSPLGQKGAVSDFSKFGAPKGIPISFRIQWVEKEYERLC